MSTQRLMSFMAHDSEEKSSTSLNHFARSSHFKPKVPSALQLYTYKQGTVFETELLLPSAPKTAQDYFNLARIMLNFKDREKVRNGYDFGASYPEFSDNPNNISTLDEFALALLEDAARTGHQKAAQLVKEFNEEHATQAKTMKQKGFILVRNKQGLKALEYWSKKSAPASIAELEETADLMEQGSQDYVFCYPYHSPEVIHQLREVATHLRKAAWEEIDLRRGELIMLAREYQTDTELKEQILALAKYNNIPTQGLRDELKDLDTLLAKHKAKAAKLRAQAPANLPSFANAVVHFQPRPASQISPTADEQERRAKIEAGMSLGLAAE